MKSSTKHEATDLHAEVEYLRARVAELEADSTVTADERTYYDFIHETAISLMQQQDLGELLDAIMQRACQIAGTGHGFLFLQGEGDQYKVHAPSGMFVEELALSKPSSPHGSTRLVFETSQPQVIYDYDNYPERYKAVPFGRIYAIATLPLMTGERLIGTMSVVYEEADRRFSDKTLQRLTAFADMASIALHNARLYRDLQESQHFIKRIADAVPDVLHVYDYENNRSIYANHPVGKLLGYSSEQIRAMGHKIMSQVIHPDDREVFNSAQLQLQEANNDDAVVTQEYRLRHADGIYRWFRSRNTAFTRDANGLITQSIGITSEITNEKRIVNELRQSEERFRVMVDAAPVGIVLTRRGTLMSVNPEFCRMLGYAEYELLGIHFSHITPAEDSVRELVLVDRVLKGETNSYRIEKQFIRKDGSRFWARVSSSALMGLENITGMGIIEDITERKAAEMALRESEARFRSIFESAAVGIAVTDDQGYLREANKAFCDMFGYRVDEVHDQPFLEYTHPDDYEAEVALVMELLRHEREQYTIEKRVLHRDGHYMWVRLTGSLINLRGHVRGIGVIEDITARKEAEAQLRASELRFRTLLDVIPVMIVIYQNDQITYVNPTGLIMSGVDPDMTSETGYDQMLPSEVVSALMEVTEGKAADKLHERREIELNTSQGERRWLDLAFLETMLDGQDAIIGIGLDVTERKEAETRSVKLALERERLRVLADFIRDAGHDFRTPLAVINTSLHLLERTEDVERRSARVKVIRDQVDHLDRLVDGLLLMVRHDSELPMSMHALNVNSLLQEGMTRLHEYATENKQTLEFDLSPERLITLGNALELHRAITGIVDNALRYSPAEATVRVETRRDGLEVVIRVIDHGTGIRPEEQERIFERFYRADEGRAAGGLGLGLSLAQRIVERHHGRIEVESVYGEGSTFTIRLPLVGVPLK